MSVSQCKPINSRSTLRLNPTISANPQMAHPIRSIKPALQLTLQQSPRTPILPILTTQTKESQRGKENPYNTLTISHVSSDQMDSGRELCFHMDHQNTTMTGTYLMKSIPKKSQRSSCSQESTGTSKMASCLLSHQRGNGFVGTFENICGPGVQGYLRIASAGTGV